MKKVCKIIRRIVFNILFFYLPFVAIEVNFNPIEWSVMCRAIAVVLCVTFNFIILLGIRVRKLKEKENVTECINKNSTIRESEFMKRIEERRIKPTDINGNPINIKY